LGLELKVIHVKEAGKSEANEQDKGASEARLKKIHASNISYQ
jgi:hypothetical protein